jgi:hypothetical protein
METTTRVVTFLNWICGQRWPRERNTLADGCGPGIGIQADHLDERSADHCGIFEMVSRLTSWAIDLPFGTDYLETDTFDSKQSVHPSCPSNRFVHSSKQSVHRRCLSIQAGCPSNRFVRPSSLSIEGVCPSKVSIEAVCPSTRVVHRSSLSIQALCPSSPNTQPTNFVVFGGRKLVGWAEIGWRTE